MMLGRALICSTTDSGKSLSSGGMTPSLSMNVSAGVGSAMMMRSRRQSIPSLASPRTLTARNTSSCWPGGKLREINPGVVDVFLDLRIGFFPPLRRDDKVALVYELSIEEDLDVQIRRCGHDISAQRIDPANGLPDAPLRPLVNAVPLEDERVLVTEVQFVTRLREEIRIDAAIEFVEFFPRQQANLIEPFKASLLAAKLDARSQPFAVRLPDPPSRAGRAAPPGNSAPRLHNGRQP